MAVQVGVGDQRFDKSLTRINVARRGGTSRLWSYPHALSRGNEAFGVGGPTPARTTRARNTPPPRSSAGSSPHERTSGTKSGTSSLAIPVAKRPLELENVPRIPERHRIGRGREAESSRARQNRRALVTQHDEHRSIVRCGSLRVAEDFGGEESDPTDRCRRYVHREHGGDGVATAMAVLAWLGGEVPRAVAAPRERGRRARP